MRCLTLAAEMERRGADVLFVCSAATASTVPALARSRTVWFEADQHDWSAALSDGTFDGKRIDLVVVDSYRLGETFERSLRKLGSPILVIDDAPARPHNCDLLVDMTLSRSANAYSGLLPQGCRVLAGTSYTLLRSEFGELRAASLARRRGAYEAKSIFVSLGLTDAGGQTANITRSLVAAGNFSRIVVVSGPAARSFDELSALASRDTRIEVLVDPDNIADLMAYSDVAIGTPGISSWERCCLGLPAILIVVADNQRDNARALEVAGAAQIASIDSEGPDAVLRILRELSVQPGKLEQMSRQAADVCDGDGAQRVGTAIDEFLLPERAERLTLRPATIADARRLWLWRNDPRAREMFGDSQPVSWDTHELWFKSRLTDPNTRIFVVEAFDRPCGYVRFHVELTGTATVSIAMARHVRGLGYGTTALALACREVFEQRFCECIEALVKRVNAASQQVFLKSGFLPVGEDADFFVYHLHARTDAHESRTSGQAE